MRRQGQNGERNWWEPRGHHIQYYAAQHEAMLATKAIRQMPGLIVPGWRRPHMEVHAAVEHVPALSQYMAAHVLQIYEDYPEDHLRSADNLMSAIEAAQRHRKATDIEIAVGTLAIQAVDLQRPFIRDMIRRQ